MAADLAEQDTIDVLVAGGGPVGAALAIALRQAGIGVRLVEPRERPATVLRPIALSHGSRVILDRLGVFAGLRTTPIETIHVSQAGGFGRTLIRREDQGVPALGYVTDLAELASALIAATGDDREEGRVARWRHTEGAIRAVLALGESERELQTRLLVLADGGASVGDDTSLRDYGQTAIVATVRTERGAPGVAWERFTQEGPLALLPFGDRYAVVWTVSATHAPALLALDSARFLRSLETAFGARLGRFLDCSERVSYPLQLRFRQSNVPEERVVVIGNAAQTLHPVAGQGLNLGLRDAFELAELVMRTPPEALGCREFLAAFGAERRVDRFATIGVTDGLVRIFSNASGPLRIARGIGLTALDLFPPARRFFARRMMFGARALP